MQKTLLTNIGLTGSEALVYETVVQKGALTASRIALYSDLSRTNVYHHAKTLIDKGLLEEVRRGKKTLFNATHPQRLWDLIDIQKKKLNTASQSLELAMPTIVSNYDAAQGKPTTMYYAGDDGLQKVFADILTSKTVVQGFMDYVAINHFGLTAEFADFAKKREMKKLLKQTIALETPKLKKSYTGKRFPYSETKLISLPSDTVVPCAFYIYDGRIAYITMQEGRRYGVIISDPSIYLMHKTAFEFAWKFARQHDNVHSSLPVN